VKEKRRKKKEKEEKVFWPSFLVKFVEKKLK